jgi:hypothetical protein
MTALLEILDASLKTSADAALIVGRPVIGLIPIMVTPVDRRRRRWRQAALSAGLAVVFASCATALWLTFHP